MMVLRRAALLAIATGALLLAGGCKTLGSCKNPITDADSPKDQPLKMPVGLDGPDTTQAMTIPPLTQPEAPRGKGDSCLEEPPAMREPGSHSAPIAEGSAPGDEPPKKWTRPAGPPR